MFRAGGFVADHVSPTESEQVQPNGVDLTVEQVAEPIDAGRVGRTDTAVANRQPVPPTEVTSESETYYLGPGAYVVRYGETVTVPAEHVGFIYPRSTLMRNGAMLHTAVWDAGYEGQGAGLLVAHHDVEIEQGARIGQLVFARADHTGTYEGAYQGEGED